MHDRDGAKHGRQELLHQAGARVRVCVCVCACVCVCVQKSMPKMTDLGSKKGAKREPKTTPKRTKIEDKNRCEKRTDIRPS